MPDLVVINKKKRTSYRVDLVISTDHSEKIVKSKKKKKKKMRLILGSCLRAEKSVEHERIGDKNCAFGTVRNVLEKRLKELKIRGKIVTSQITALLK